MVRSIGNLLLVLAVSLSAFSSPALAKPLELTTPDGEVWPCTFKPNGKPVTINCLSSEEPPQPTPDPTRSPAPTASPSPSPAVACDGGSFLKVSDNEMSRGSLYLGPGESRVVCADLAGTMAFFELHTNNWANGRCNLYLIEATSPSGVKRVTEEAVTQPGDAYPAEAGRWRFKVSLLDENWCGEPKRFDLTLTWSR